ncbi:diguanylate cyclase [Rhodobacterales bacterium]|nr:diguanylate cyclase [Rhodobacterales bacterium]
MLDAGADDVVKSSDTAALGLALKRAEKVLLREGDLKRRIREVSIERNNLQSAIDHLPSPIFFKDGDGVYTGCNKAFEEYLGLSSRQIVGSTVYDVSSSKYAGIYVAADLVLLKEGGVQIYDSEVCFPNGEVRFVTFHKAVTHDKMTGEVNGLAGAMLDITERKHLEKSLKHAAERDHLTGAFNRRKFFQIAEEMDRDPIRDELGAMVLVMDVDHFKRINDRYGHACGDEALKHLVSILQEHLPEPNIFARAGGEEFFAILRGFTQADAWRRADAIRRAVEANSFKFAGEAVRLTISIGAAMIGTDESVASAVLRADHALYRAKESGRNELAVD